MSSEAGEGMLLGGVLVGVDEDKHLVQVDVQQLSGLVHQVQGN